MAGKRTKPGKALGKYLVEGLYIKGKKKPKTTAKFVKPKK